MAANIENYDSDTLLSGTSGNDEIYNGEAVVGGGDDGGEEGGSNVTIDARAGNDYTFNNGNYVSISGGKGNDTIENGCDFISCYDHEPEEGEFVFRNGGNYVTISGGAGKDYIYTDGIYASVSGGDGITPTIKDTKN